MVFLNTKTIILLYLKFCLLNRISAVADGSMANAWNDFHG